VIICGDNEKKLKFFWYRYDNNNKTKKLRGAMASKKYPSWEKHPTAKCVDCKKPLKKRLVEQKKPGNFKRCYSCYIKKRKATEEKRYREQLMQQRQKK